MSRGAVRDRRRASARRLTAAVILGGALAWALPAQASAHAVLQHTDPHQNSAIASAPAEVHLGFNEPVEVSFGAVRVFDTAGDRVDAGEIGQEAGEPESVTVGLRDGLGRGVYTTTYRVVSADGHPVSGGFAFGVGEQVTARRDTPQVADLLARSAAGPAVEGVYGTARGLHYAALLLLVGAVFFRLLVWPAGTSAQWPRRLLAVAAVIGLLSALVGVALQGALGAGLSLGHALDAEVLSGSIDTRTGGTWLARAAVWALVVVVVLGLRRGFRSRREALLLAVPAAVLLGTLPFAGHASTQSPRGVLIPADLVHGMAAGAWLGGLILLLTCFWPRRSSAELADGAADATARFSRLAVTAIVVLVAAGTVQAWFYLGSVGAFFDSLYGWALIAKIGLVLGIIGLGAGNRRRTARLAGGDASPARSLRRSMRIEIVIALLVLSATATLVRAAPPATLESGPIIRELNLGPMRLQMDIEPGIVGPNDYHLYLFDRRTGAQVDRVKELTVRLVQRDKDIGPITIDMPFKNRAHYELLNSTLGVTGTWSATVTARVSEFDEYSAKTTFEVRE